MITKYEIDIEALKNKKSDQESSMTEIFKRARDNESDLISGLTQ